MIDQTNVIQPLLYLCHSSKNFGEPQISSNRPNSGSPFALFLSTDLSNRLHHFGRACVFLVSLWPATHGCVHCAGHRCPRWWGLRTTRVRFTQAGLAHHSPPTSTTPLGGPPKKTITDMRNVTQLLQSNASIVLGTVKHYSWKVRHFVDASSTAAAGQPAPRSHSKHTPY